MDKIDKSSSPPFLFNYFPCLKSLWEKVRNLAEQFYTLFMDFYWGKPLPKEVLYDVARLDESFKKRDFERDSQCWELLSVRIDTLVNGVYSLGPIDKGAAIHPSGFPPTMQIGSCKLRR